MQEYYKGLQGLEKGEGIFRVAMAAGRRGPAMVKDHSHKENAAQRDETLGQSCRVMPSFQPVKKLRHSFLLCYHVDAAFGTFYASRERYATVKKSMYCTSSLRAQPSKVFPVFFGEKAKFC